MKRRTTEECEMCSASVANPTTIKVEGALLSVCSNCTSFGNIVKEQTQVPLSQHKKGSRTKGRVKPTEKKKVVTSSKPKPVEAELVTDFDVVIRQARQKKKLSHEKLSALTGITVATLKSIESGKMRPTDRDAKKIERELGVELLFKLDVELEHAEKTKKRATTLGDIAVIRKYDYDDE